MMPAVYYHWRGDYPATMDVQLLTSRDGISWRRAGERRPFLRRGLDGSATSGWICANPWLIPMGDELARDNQGENAATIKMRMPRRLAAL